MTGLLFFVLFVTAIAATLEWQHRRYLKSGAVPDRPHLPRARWGLPGFPRRPAGQDARSVRAYC